MGSGMRRGDAMQWGIGRLALRVELGRCSVRYPGVPAAIGPPAAIMERP